MDYIFTFLVYLIEILQKRYKGLFIDRRSHVSIWKWIKKYKPKKVLSSKRKKSNEFIIDETQIKVGWFSYIYLALGCNQLSQNIGK